MKISKAAHVWPFRVILAQKPAIDSLSSQELVIDPLWPYNSNISGAFAFKKACEVSLSECVNGGPLAKRGVPFLPNFEIYPLIFLPNSRNFRISTRYLGIFSENVDIF